MQLSFGAFYSLITNLTDKRRSIFVTLFFINLQAKKLCLCLLRNYKFSGRLPVTPKQFSSSIKLKNFHLFIYLLQRYIICLSTLNNANSKSIYLPSSLPVPFKVFGTYVFQYLYTIIYVAYIIIAVVYKYILFLYGHFCYYVLSCIQFSKHFFTQSSTHRL